MECSFLRLADHRIDPGVVSESLGEGDDRPAIHAQIVAAEILLMCTPTWLGQPSSLCQAALERMNGVMAETTEDGAPVAYNRVAGIAVTGPGARTTRSGRRPPGRRARATCCTWRGRSRARRSPRRRAELRRPGRRLIRAAQISVRQTAQRSGQEHGEQVKETAQENAAQDSRQESARRG